MKKFVFIASIALILTTTLSTFVVPTQSFSNLVVQYSGQRLEGGVPNTNGDKVRSTNLSSVIDLNLSPFQETWVDEFDTPTVETHWSWVREDPGLWSLTNNPGNLQITSSGSLFQTINDQKNLLISPAPSGDFRITTKVHASPSDNYHGAGVYIYEDDDNYFAVLRMYNEGQVVGFRTEVAGVPFTWYQDVTQDTLLLRIIKEGDDISGWYSEDEGGTWQFINTVNHTLAYPQVGLGARMGPTTTPITADFDWIRLERIIYNCGWIDNFEGPVLKEYWSWERENPSLWSLSVNPGSLQLTSSGSIYETVSNDMANVLLTSVPGDDFRITGKVTAIPTENYHGGPIIVYQDDDNYIELSFEYRDGMVVTLRKEEAGAASLISDSVVEETIWLRLSKEGVTYYAWYSEVSEGSWEYLGQSSVGLGSPQVGISAEMGPTMTPITVNWDYFKLECYSEKIYLPIILR